MIIIAIGVLLSLLLGILVILWSILPIFLAIFTTPCDNGECVRACSRKEKVGERNENPTTRGDIDIAWAQYFLGKYHIMNDQHAEALSAFDAGAIVLEQCPAEFPDSKDVRRAIQDYTKGRDNWIEHLKNVS